MWTNDVRPGPTDLPEPLISAIDLLPQHLRELVRNKMLICLIRVESQRHILGTALWRGETLDPFLLPTQQAWVYQSSAASSGTGTSMLDAPDPFQSMDRGADFGVCLNIFKGTTLEGD